ncbi:MAG: Tad domain-containing protein, partial [Candidatus Binatia bacterium]
MKRFNDEKRYLNASVPEILMVQGKISSCTKGQVLIFVTLAFVVLGLLIGLAVDGGRAYLVRSR